MYHTGTLTIVGTRPVEMTTERKRSTTAGTEAVSVQKCMRPCVHAYMHARTYMNRNSLPIHTVTP